MKKFKTLYAIVFMVLSLTFTINLQAQGGGNADGGYNGATGFGTTTGPGSEGGNCGNGPHTHAGNAICNKGGGDSIPLDGGLGILLAGAAVFGLRKLRKA
jgi:hypothetical protein